MIRFLKPAGGRPLVSRLKAEIADPEIERLVDTWLRLAGDGPLPDKSGFDPLEHPRLLPRMWIYQLTDDRRDFIGRLCGEEIRHVWGRSTKGVALSQIATPENLRTNLQRWLYCVSAPAVLLGRSSSESARFVVKRLSLPFRDREGGYYVVGASRYDFNEVDPFDGSPPYRHSQSAVAVRAFDLIADARLVDAQAIISSRTCAAQASPSA